MPIVRRPKRKVLTLEDKIKTILKYSGINKVYHLEQLVQDEVYKAEQALKKLNNS